MTLWNWVKNVIKTLIKRLFGYPKTKVTVRPSKLGGDAIQSLKRAVTCSHEYHLKEQSWIEGADGKYTLKDKMICAKCHLTKIKSII